MIQVYTLEKGKAIIVNRVKYKFKNILIYMLIIKTEKVN